VARPSPVALLILKSLHISASLINCHTYSNFFFPCHGGAFFHAHYRLNYAHHHFPRTS
jgi:hypothetical protein